MTTSERLELEIELLEKKTAALKSDITYKNYQYENNTPCEPGMDGDVGPLLLMSGLERDRARLDVEIAEKRMQLYDILGATRPGNQAPQ